MGGGSGTTTVEKSDPWWGAQPFLLTGMDRALENLNAGPAPTTALTNQAIGAYQGIGTSAPFQQALAQTSNTAANGYGGAHQGASQAMLGMGQAGSLNPTAAATMQGLAQGGATNHAAMGTLQALMQNGSTDPQALAALRGLGASGSTDAQGMDLLRRTAGGEFMAEGNPYLQRVVDQNIAAARPSLDAAFAASGRGGSGAHAAAFADAALRQSNELGYQNYQQERGYQNAAAGALLAQGNADAAFRAGVQGNILQQGNTNAAFQGNMAGAVLGQGNTDAALRLNAAQGLQGATAQDFQSRLAALQGGQAGIQSDWDARMAAAGLLPSYAQVGPDSLAQAQALQAAEMQRLNPWTDLGNYWNIAGQAGGMGGGKTSTGPGVDNTGAYVGAGAAVAGAAIIAI
jgi:hypothetical protein